MGILADLEEFNPKTLVSDLEAAKAKIAEYECRISSLESAVVPFLTSIQSAIPTIESMLPAGTSPQLLTALKLIASLSLSGQSTLCPSSSSNAG